MVAEKAFRFVEVIAMIKGIPKDKITFLNAKDIARLDTTLTEWKETLDDA